MTQPPVPPFPPPGPPTQKTERRIGRGILITIAVLAIGFGGYIAGTQTGDDTDPKPRTKSSATADDVDLDPPVLDGPTSEYEEYDENDFLIELKTLKKQCFGSAGCNLTLEPEITFMWDTEDIDPDATYTITYEVTGGEDGTVTDTLTLTNQDDITYNKTFLQTSTSDAEIEAEITDVTVS